MFVPCPHCGFLVALILPSPAAAPVGAVPRCPRCDGALRVEIPESYAPTETAPAAVPGSAAAGTATGGVDDDAPTTPAGVASDARAAEAGPDETSLPAPAHAASPSASASPSPTRAARPRRTPSFVRGNTPATTRRVAWPWFVAIAALGLVLAMQLLLAQRHELAASARWRPWVEGLCSVLPCEVPAWREPQAFTMLDRSVQPSAAMPGVLAVEANFRNDARWPQPWPTLVLSLSDVEGRQVGLRAFAPSEYRQSGAGATDLLAPGQSATVRLQVREPAPRIVAFTFDFQ